MAEDKKKKKNQKFGQPFFTTPKSKVIQRKEFLDSKLKVYYTPGQNPDVGEPDLYTPPSTNWQPANQILYRPQTVWLYISHSIQSSYSHNIDPIAIGPIQANISQRFNEDPQIWKMNYYGDESLSAVAYIQLGQGSGTNHDEPYKMSLGNWIPIPSLDFSGHKVWYFNQGNVSLPTRSGPGEHSSYNFNIDNPYIIEYNRLMEILNEVKRNIEKLRPNRTFIQIIDPWIYNVPPPGLHKIPSNYFGGPRDQLTGVGGPMSKFFLNFPELYWPMICPSDDKDFFGVNFLCLHFGGCDTTEFLIVDASKNSDGGQLDQINVARPHSLAIIKDRVNKFCNYSQKYFGYDVEIPKVPKYIYASSNPPDFTITVRVARPPVPPHDPGDVGETVHMYSSQDRALASSEFPTGYWLPTDANSGETSDAGFSQSTSNLQRAIDNDVDNFNKLSNQPIQANIKQLQTDASDLRELQIDASYESTTSQVNIEYLVKLIAKHYKFNPTTGKDLDPIKGKDF